MATLDAIFDARLIAFGDDGAMLLSPRLPVEQRQVLGITPGTRLRRRPTSAQCEYLRYHRKHRFRRE